MVEIRVQKINDVMPTDNILYLNCVAPDFFISILYDSYCKFHCTDKITQLIVDGTIPTRKP